MNYFTINGKINTFDKSFKGNRKFQKPCTRTRWIILRENIWS